MDYILYISPNGKRVVLCFFPNYAGLLKTENLKYTNSVAWHAANFLRGEEHKDEEEKSVRSRCT